MRFFITKKNLVWVIIALCALTILISLSACGSREAVPEKPETFLSGGPGGILIKLSLVATALAGTGLIACAFLAIFYYNKFYVAKLAIACTATIVGSQIVYQFGHHLGAAALVAAVLSVAAAGWWGWAHLGKIEKKIKLDLNFNGRIG